jgi:uncharacterized protein (DUF2236 family)
MASRWSTARRPTPAAAVAAGAPPARLEAEFLRTCGERAAPRTGSESSPAGPTFSGTPTVIPNEAALDGLILGPDSVAWRATSDLRLYLGMLYPLLLQVAHPTVDAGVADHSDFEHRPWDRLLRTVDYVSLLVYGGPNAIEAGRRLRALHKRFRGTSANGSRYSALEPTAYAWVHATLIDTYVRTNARFGRALSRNERDHFYREYRDLGRLIGVRERDLPPTWAGFRVYFDATARDTLASTKSVERVLATVHDAGAPPMPISDLAWRAIRVPARRALFLGGVGLMDPWLRRRLHIRWTPIDDAQFLALGALSRALGPAMPASLKTIGPGHLRWRHAEIAAGPLGPGA